MEFKILPAQKAPQLKVALTDGGNYDLSAETPKSFSLVVFYRGLHCPLCKGYIEELAGRLDSLADLGVGVVAVSMDARERATKTTQDWNLGALRLGFNLTAEDARNWGLFVSEAVKDSEPPYFTEPALFLVRSDGTIYSQHVQNVPFARPRWDDYISSIEFVLKKDYPVRGTVASRAREVV